MCTARGKLPLEMSALASHGHHRLIIYVHACLLSLCLRLPLRLELLSWSPHHILYTEVGGVEFARLDSGCFVTTARSLLSIEVTEKLRMQPVFETKCCFKISLYHREINKLRKDKTIT